VTWSDNNVTRKCHTKLGVFDAKKKVSRWLIVVFGYSTTKSVLKESKSNEDWLSTTTKKEVAHQTGS
jgi:hypothetical protein